MRCRGPVVVLVGLALPLFPAFAQSPADSYLTMGIRQVESGDLEVAIFTLDTAIRRLMGQPHRRRELTQAYLYLGAAYVGLNHDEAARGKFREALALDPALRLDSERFPRRVLDVFEGQRLRATAAKSRRGRTIALVVGGVGAATAVAISAATTGPPANRPPTATIAVTPEGDLIPDVTSAVFTANASDPEGGALTYSWNLGDGSTVSGATARHVYVSEGTYTVTLTVSDTGMASATAAAVVRVRSLTGTWLDFFPDGPDELACRQSGTAFSCDNLTRRYTESHLVWRVTLADPRRVVAGELVRANGGVRTCTGGEVESNLNRILCVASTQTLDIRRR